MGWEVNCSYMGMGMHRGQRSRSQRGDWCSHTGEEAVHTACEWEARGHHSHHEAQMNDVVSGLGLPHVPTVVSQHVTSYFAEQV